MQGRSFEFDFGLVMVMIMMMMPWTLPLSQSHQLLYLTKRSTLSSLGPPLPSSTKSLSTLQDT
jgi:hypothetical protein